MAQCNINVNAKGYIGPTSCAGVFRYKDDAFIGGFAAPLNIQNTFHAKLMTILFAIKSAYERQ